MYTLGIGGLVTAYVALALLLLSINLYSNWSWKIKAVTIVLTSVFYVVSYLSFPPLLGWPTTDTPPERFQLIGSYVVQPNKLTGDKGSIFLWLTRFEDLATQEKPRAYELPYSNELHELIINANSKLNKGIPQLGEMEDRDNVIDKLKDAPRSGQKTVKIEFYDMPDPLFPDK